MKDVTRTMAWLVAHNATRAEPSQYLCNRADFEISEAAAKGRYKVDILVGLEDQNDVLNLVDSLRRREFTVRTRGVGRRFPLFWPTIKVSWKS